jgi:hypothetical protein
LFVAAKDADEGELDKLALHRQSGSIANPVVRQREAS